ncbi:MAG: Flp family type IVb pilin [Hyphomonadaceae bacterium]|nr:Flp family type IVb pilin [Hyphomonadaceae bacterium]
MLKLFVKTQTAIADLKKNVEGASLIEYSLLIGLISAAVVLIIGLMGNKVVNWWSALNSATGAAP